MQSWRLLRCVRIRKALLGAGKTGVRILGRVEKGFFEKEKEMVSRRPMQLTSKIRPYVPSTEQGSDCFLNYVVEAAIVEKRWKAIEMGTK